MEHYMVDRLGDPDLVWRVSSVVQQSAQQMLGWSPGRRWPQNLTQYYHDQRRDTLMPPLPLQILYSTIPKLICNARVTRSMVADVNVSRRCMRLRLSTDLT
jgi:hypothetical protein